MLLHTGGSTRGWGESVSPHSATWKTPVPSLGCKHRYLKRFHLSPGRQGLPVPAQQTAPAGICAPWPGPGQLSLSRSCRQWTTRGRKYSQKQLAKALAQPTPCLYLLRGLDLVQILEKKKNRKCFTCYLMWVPARNSCCAWGALWWGQVPPGRLRSCCHSAVWGQAKHIPSSPGISHSMTSPFSKIFPFLLFHLSLVTHRAGR